MLDVVDQGPGVAADERERIFDSFYQGQAPVDGRVKGSGLGLAIAREYALAQAGRIEVARSRRRQARRVVPPVAAARRTASAPANGGDATRRRRSRSTK